MANQQDEKVILAWTKGEYKSYARANVLVQGNVLYSYGTHFELGRILGEGDAQFAVLNGDRSSVTTTTHQGEARMALRRKNIPFIIVPYSALSAARVQLSTIKPVDVRPDGTTWTTITHDEPPASMYSHSSEMYWCAWRDAQALYRDNGDGEGLVLRPDFEHFDVVGVIPGGGAFKQVVIRNPDGTYTWNVARHWLGDSVFTATVGDGWRGEIRENVPFISSFDRQEPRPLYFLSELPRAATDLDDALEALKPESVVYAESMGRECTRQGDMFAIPTDITTRDLSGMGARRERRKLTMVLSRRARTMLFWQERYAALVDSLSSEELRPAMPTWDRKDDYPTFRARLDAHHAMDRAWLAEMRKRVTIGLTDRAVQDAPFLDAAAKFQVTEWDRTRDVDCMMVLGTSHTATECAMLPDGTTFVRGSWYHEPGGREKDHVRRMIGDGKAWHVVARNTVPLQG